MERYFFHLRDGQRFYQDHEGVVLGSRQEILPFASELAGALVEPKIRCDWGKSAIEVTNDGGSLTLILSMASLALAPHRHANGTLVEAQLDRFRSTAPKH